MLDRRQFLILCALLATAGSATAVVAKDGNSGGSGGSGNSGSGGGGGGGHGGGEDEDDDDDDDNDNSKLEDGIAQKVARGDIEPLAKILKAALDHTPGKILDVKVRLQDGAYIYRIKILGTNGRKRELFIDAKTLAVIKAS